MYNRCVFIQGLRCNIDICEQGPCQEDDDCGHPAACIDGFCDLDCLKNSDCFDGMICKNSRCLPCEKDSECEGVS